ncbi:MAG: AIDA repeat-containing protein [Lentisphaeria bacterium]|nr:AIDA repeat-containing protein [Lentisphaeria bacterium]
MSGIIVSSGEISSGILLENNSMFVSSGGIANDTTINSGFLNVQPGGTVNRTTVNSQACYLNIDGTANSTTVKSRGGLRLYDGTANDTTLLDNGSMYVYSGGTANRTTLNWGVFLVHSGGTAIDTEINSWGNMDVSSDGTAINTTVNSDGFFGIDSGAIVNSVTVMGGYFLIRSGATPSNVTLNGGSAFIKSGGTATNVIENGGYLELEDGAAAVFVPHTISGLLLSSATATVHSSTRADDTTIEDGGCLFVSGGTVNNTTVNPDGFLGVSSGGKAIGITINYIGQLYVVSGGTACDTTVNSGGKVWIDNGGTADSTVFDGGWLTVSSGGTANEISLTNAGAFISGGTVISATINGLGGLSDSFGFVISSGGTAISTTVRGFNYTYGIVVSSGGTAIGTTIDGLNGYTGLGMVVSSGGTAYDTTVKTGGIFYVSSDGRATAIRENGGYVSAYDDALISFTPNTFSGMILEGGPIIEKDSWYHLSRGSATIHSGTTANSAAINGGHLFVYSGGAVSSTTLTGNLTNFKDNVISCLGEITVYGGSIDHAVVNSLGKVDIFSGGTANITTVNSGGSVCISSGGTAGKTIVNNDGFFHVLSGGTADGLVVSSGGVVLVNGILSGQITIERGADLFLDQDAVFDFDLTPASLGGEALVNGFSRIAGDASYTLTVREDQPVGIYQLARNVHEFDKTISVTSVSGTKLSTLSVGQTVFINNLSYTLSLDDASLFLSIREPGPDTIAPAVFSVRQSHSDPTLRAVTVTADFADDVALKSRLYRIGEDGAWLDYTSGVTLTENATVYFKAVDASGNESEVVSRSVTNIEKNVHDPVYVYLDFDGENTFYDNQDLDLSFAVTVADPGFSDTQKQAILSELADRYAADGVAFTLTRPENTEYSTLYFGKSDDFADYGRYFGISETLDACNRIKNDNAFILLDSTYSLAQTISVAETALDHILGCTCSPMGELQLRNYAINSYLLSTEWHQVDPYNKYCPIDPVTEIRCVTGCVATEASQIIYYWIENGMLDFTLAMDDSENRFTRGLGLIDADPGNVEKYGYLSFAETNELLKNFKLGDEESIAALCFAAGMGAIYTSDGTGMGGLGNRTFTRSGLQDNSYHQSLMENITYDFYVREDGIADYSLKNMVWEVLIREILAGRPVAAVALSGAHAIVIDGYDSTTDTFHANYGWGGLLNGWYSMDELVVGDKCNYGGLINILCYITPEVCSDLAVSELSFEQDAVKQGKDVIVNVSMSNSGNVKSSESMAYVYAGDTLLSSQVLDFLYPGETRVFALTVDSTGLSLGENAITVRVDSPDSEKVLFSSQTIEVLENVMLNAQFYTGDFDGDLFDTLAVQSGSTVTIYRNGEPWGFGLTLDAGWSIAGTGDFNADGLDDFLRVNTEGYVVGEMSITNVVNEDVFAPQVLNFLSPGWDILGTGNFDGVGPDDVLIANPTAASETVGLLGYWKGGTEWTLINGYSPEWTMVSTGDFNGDGKCDMLWKNSFVGDGGLTYNAYCTWIVEDPVDWRMVSVANPDEWKFLCSGDFDGNGSHDIAMINDVGVVGIWGVTDGYLSSWSILSAVTSEWQIAGVADFNADGTDDIAWSNTDTGLTGYWQINDKQLTTWANIATLS